MNTYLQYIADFIDEKNGVIQPFTDPTGSTARSIMMLSYYRNSLVHLFLNEAEIMTALFTATKTQPSATVDQIFDKVMFLKDLFSSEFVLKDTMRTKEDVISILSFMKDRKFLHFENGVIRVDPKNDEQLLCQSFLCQQVFPYIDTYALVLAYFASGSLSQLHEEIVTYQKIQWIIETLFTQGMLKYQESCMLESIRNAVRRF